ncbi:hypothetical protein GF351_02240 [Candidatus Woesearchaeota archaeon]|nr:hypothetical protein [Candidatus Woesearchaeota archaeon]
MFGWTKNDNIEAVGEYSLVGKHGSSIDYADVFHARRMGQDARIVALKEHVSGHADLVSRFQEQADLWKGLDHPNLLSIIEYGSHAGRHFYVTDHAVPLENNVLGRRRIDAADALRIARGVVHGLLYLHKHDLSQMHIYPASIFLEGQDIMVGSAIPEKLEQKPSLRFLQNTWYNAPEEIRGAHKGQKTEVFHVGALLHTMLTGMVYYPAIWNWNLPADLFGDTGKVLQKAIDRAVNKRPWRRPSLESYLDNLADTAEKYSRLVEQDTDPGA